MKRKRLDASLTPFSSKFWVTFFVTVFGKRETIDKVYPRRTIDVTKISFSPSGDIRRKRRNHD